VKPPDPDAVTGGHAPRSRGSGRHSVLFLAVAGTLAALLFIAFVALGTWQLKRRVWKLDLIARVEQRVHAPPVAAPGPAQWPNVSAATDEYRHVAVTGTFLDESQTLVQAVTERGAGYWVLTPLRAVDNNIVLVNRGFIPGDDRDRVAPAAGQPRGATNLAAGGAFGTSTGVSGTNTGAGDATGAGPGRTARTSSDSAPTGADTSASTTVIGLLRMTEPRGAFLRHNDAAANRWYSRDVRAIAAARGLTRVAPYFVDVEAAGAPAAVTASAADAAVVPIGGLTVITFHNSHLVYAITWYTLALMVAGAIWLGIRSETRA
jgi:surfeit locus 1 family protein